MPAELIKARGREIHTEIRTLCNSIGIRRNWLSRGMSQSLPIRKEGDEGYGNKMVEKVM